MVKRAYFLVACVAHSTESLCVPHDGCLTSRSLRRQAAISDRKTSMKILCGLMRVTLCALSLCLLLQSASAKDINLLPKFGGQPKSAEAIEADQEFLRNMDNLFKGDRHKAAEHVASKGWDYLRSGDPVTAMKRFNQAWLLDSRNVNALWGMSSIVGAEGELDLALSLLKEAEAIDGSDISRSSEYARAYCMVAVLKSDFAMLKESLDRFERISKQIPNSPINWQNWAMALYWSGDYAGAWEKVAKMESLGPNLFKDTQFIEELASKMPRPVSK